MVTKLIGRVLCWFGIHDMVPVDRDMLGTPMHDRCVRCQYIDWIW